MATKHMMLTTWFTTREVVEMTGATYRQIDYWCRTGLIPGHTESVGSGRRRRFTEQDVKRARLVLLASRLSNQPLEKVVAMLEHELMVQQLGASVQAIALGAAG
jgi:DNA-binding transcriptional MerR regulator